MKLVEPWDLDACYLLLLRAMVEPGDNSLRLWIEEARPNPNSTSKPLHPAFGEGVPIEPGPECNRFEICWEHYVAYSVVNESYCAPDGDAEWSGRHFRVYKKSSFLDYLKCETFATDDYPGPFMHFCVVFGHQVVNVAALQPPDVKLLDDKDEWEFAESE